MSNGASKTSVTVRIAGEEHVLRSTAEPEYTKRCAEYLDDRIVEIRSLSRLADSHRAVILAALSITDRYFQAQDALDRLREECTSRSMVLAERVEEELGATPAG